MLRRGGPWRSNERMGMEEWPLSALCADGWSDSYWRGEKAAQWTVDCQVYLGQVATAATARMNVFPLNCLDTVLAWGQIPKEPSTNLLVLAAPLLPAQLFTHSRCSVGMLKERNLQRLISTVTTADVHNHPATFQTHSYYSYCEFPLPISLLQPKLKRTSRPLPSAF